MHKQIIYLVGPITGCSYDEATEGRNAIKAELEETGRYHCLTPMRGKKHLEDEAELTACIPDHVTKPGCTDHDIFRRDHYDCHRADVLFVDLVGADIVSVGSMFEIAWGYKNGAYVLVCMDPNNVHEHIFVKEAASIILPTTQAGVNYLKNVLNA